MGHTYCSKLSVDSAAITDGTSYDPTYGFPFAGFVNFTTSGSNPFEGSQDYLQRWDVGSGMTEPVKGNAMCSQLNGTCVKINDMYCSTASSFPYKNQASFYGNNNKRFLSMAPLARGIGNNDARGLSFFMDMGKEIKTEYTFTLPYNTGSKKSLCYLDFCAAGFCKSNIPYIGIEYASRMITDSLNNADGNYYTLFHSSARNEIFGSSNSNNLSVYQNSSAGSIETYEYPGQGNLLLSPYLLVNNDYSANVWTYISRTYDDGTGTCFTYMLCREIANAIGHLCGIGSGGTITNHYDETYSITFSGVNLSTTTENKIYSFLSLINRAGAIYLKTSSGYECVSNDFQVSITFPDTNNMSHYFGVDLSHSGDRCSLFSNTLSYYIGKGEKFRAGDDEYSLDSIGVGYYFFATRSVKDGFFSSPDDLVTNRTTYAFLDKCNSSIATNVLYNRMDLYPNTTGKMRFVGGSGSLYLTKDSYSGYDSSTFKPKTLQSNQYLYANYIPAFYSTPSWSSSTSKMTNMGVIEEDVEIKFNGALYVSEVTLVFEGTTITELSDHATITVGTGSTSVTKNIKTGGSTNSYNNTEYVFTFSDTTSPARIYSSNGKAMKNNMNVYSVGAQQMLKYCSFPGYGNSGNTTFDNIYRLDRTANYSGSGNAVNPEDSQMTFTKIIGRIPVTISGSGIYKNESTTIKLISAYIKLTDTSSMDVYVYTLGLMYDDGYPSTSGDLGWMNTSSHYYFVSPTTETLSYNIHQPFLGSMSGDIPRYSGSSDSSLYNMGVSSFTSSSDSYKNKIGLDSSNNLVCVGPNYSNKTSVSGGTVETFSNSMNSAYATDLAFSQLTYDLGLARVDGTSAASGARGTSVGANSVYYSISKNPFGSSYTSISGQLNNGSYIECSLPEPHLNAILVYDSVEFNRASAWTFMRAMPLQPGSAEAPHILIYKVEAWVTEAGTTAVDYNATSSMSFDYTASTMFSGYASSSTTKSEIGDGFKFSVMGINDAINDSYILNNCYLKVDDGGNTEDLNAVGTSFPIRDITGNSDFYGAPSLNAKIYSNIADLGAGVDINNDDEIYNELFSRTKTALVNDSTTQIVVMAYCHPTLKTSTAESGDYHKVIYICVGFYNSNEEMIPINGKFGITYTVTPEGGTATPYTKYMALSEFFPKDSMIYLAGKNYKNNTEKEAHNKFAFVTNDIKSKYTTLSGDGISNAVPETSEIINIGPGTGMSYEIASTSDSNGYWGDVTVEDVTPGLSAKHYTGHYGILNRYSGKVSFVSNVPYKDYQEYTDSLQGKCLLSHEHICYFSNKTGVVTLL